MPWSLLQSLPSPSPLYRKTILASHVLGDAFTFKVEEVQRVGKQG